MSDDKEKQGEKEWEEPTNEYGKPGLSPSDKGDDAQNTVDSSTLPGAALPTPQDEVPTEAATPGVESRTILEVPLPAPPPPPGEALEQRTMLDVGEAASMDDDPTESREEPSDAGFLNESTKIDDGMLDRYRKELEARKQAEAEGSNDDDGMRFDDETDFEMPRPALVDVEPVEKPRATPPTAPEDEEEDPFELADALPGFEDDPFEAAGAQLTTIPDVIPSDKSAVSQLTDSDAERLSQTDKFAIPRELQQKTRPPATTAQDDDDDMPSTLDGVSPPLADLDAEDEPTDAAEPPSMTQENVRDYVSSEGEEQELALGTRDISVESPTPDVQPDLPDAEPDELPAAKSGPKGTLVLELAEDDVSQEVDPAMLPPAFPATTGNVLENATSAMPGKPPPPPSAADLAEQAPEDDAWAGYDDSGGWHTLTGESQVLMADSAKSEAPAPPPAPRPMPQASSSAVFDSSQPGDAQERAQLVGIQGADTGRQHSITGDEVLIGRSSRCSVVLAEPSVSRQHARIERREDGFWVVDLDSGNGTYVNGQRVSEFRVFSGDEVTFGNGSFQFIETGERFEQVDASAAPVRAEAAHHVPAPSGPIYLQPVALVIASAVMLVVVGVVFITLQVSADREEERLHKAFTSWKLGRENFSRQQWNQAEVAFNDALAHVDTHLRSLRYLDALRREREAQKVLAEAETALEQQEYETAFNLANRATDSIAYGRDAEKVIEAVDEQLERRLRRARASKNRIEAVEVLQGFEFMSPYRPEIEQLRREGPRRPEEAVEEEAPPKKEGSGAVDDDRNDGAANQRRKSGGPDPESGGAVGRARDAFVSGDLARAKRLIANERSPAAIRMGDLLQQFDDVYREAKSAFRAKRARAAVSQLDESLALERRIAAGESSFAREIEKQLAGAHYLDGVDLFTSNRYPEAYGAFGKALQFDPEHAGSQRMLNRLVDRAQLLLDQAEVSERRQARSLYETVLLMVPASHDAYRRAKQGLKRVR